MTTNPPKQLQAKQAQTPRAEKSFKWLIILLAIVAGCLLAFYFLNFRGGIGDKGDFGAFGDYFGGVLNPILGFATVSLLVWSLKYQMDELALSRQELALTRQELAETKEETALSRKAMEEQVNHIKNEAKLNELTRLLDLSQKKYEVIIGQPFPVKSVQTSPQSTQMLNDTYHSFLNNTLLHVDPHYYPKFALAVTKNEDVTSHLNRLRRETILISDLALKYYSINESEEFARAYMFDSYDMLQIISRIYPDEITQDRITTIASLLAEYMDVAKVSNTDKS
ncbi:MULTISPECIES: hypothetical protein [unclassified Shewanella]|uniref:hypothetical protein n=1 Tax=unclassified Shewanella TaxID=196818 RepID=UPI0021D8D5AA|nr:MULTISPECIES: hypothetical protein [unclassified Shewanella]MCU8035046.1 hypothetical protein [Shewanella sp. SM71]MCU8096916.1 hypothetical protein [Shewanella sp. SM102]